MNKHDVEVTQDDVASVVAKARAFAEALPPAEQAAWRLILTSLAEHQPAEGDVEGHGWGITIGLPGIWTHRLLEFDDLLPGSGVKVRDHRVTVRDHRR